MHLPLKQSNKYATSSLHLLCPKVASVNSRISWIQNARACMLPKLVNSYMVGSSILRFKRKLEASIKEQSNKRRRTQ